MSLLVLDGVSKQFGGLLAVNRVSFSLEAGSVTGLIGPNGAGKTTVFNLITGNLRPDRGRILFGQQPIHQLPPHRLVEMGIARTFQSIRLFQNMSVVENVLAGCHCRLQAGLWASLVHTRAQRQEEREALDYAAQVLDFVGLSAEAQQLAKNLSYGKQRLLEIARALATRPSLLILDEPAGGMNERETAELTRLIQLLQRQGMAILLIEHDMKLVMQACDQLVVLEYGCQIAAGPPARIQQDAKVIAAYLGTEED